MHPKINGIGGFLCSCPGYCFTTALMQDLNLRTHLKVLCKLNLLNTSHPTIFFSYFVLLDLVILNTFDTIICWRLIKIQSQCTTLFA